MSPEHTEIEALRAAMREGHRALAAKLDQAEELVVGMRDDLVRLDALLDRPAPAQEPGA